MLSFDPAAPSARRGSRALVANIGSKTMGDDISLAYEQAMARVSSRAVWSAREGDTVVTQAPCRDVFRSYVESVTGVALDSYRLIAPAAVETIHPLSALHNRGDAAVHHVTACDILAPFALDNTVLVFARDHKMPILDYDNADGPSDETLHTVASLNTKSGFRELAASLGVPTAEGMTSDRANLTDIVREMLSESDAVIVKPDRSSTGFGNVRVDSSNFEHVVDELLTEVQSDFWIVEHFLPFTAVPSYEFRITDTYTSSLYSCDQRTSNNGWTGMVSPAASSAAEAEILTAAMAVATHLRQSGYRGVFDMDCGLLQDGSWVASEINVRDTGGTYLHDLVESLGGHVKWPYWSADSAMGRGQLDFAAATHLLERHGLSDTSGASRAILTTDAHHLDGRWRYLVVARGINALNATERTVRELLGLPPLNSERETTRP